MEHAIFSLVDSEIDEVRSFWDSRPCNIRHSSEPIGTKKYFDEVEARKYYVEPHIPNFANFADWNGKSVLEIGCGIGTDAINFVRNGAIYTGVELSESSLDIAKQRFDIFGVKGEFLLGNAEEIDKLITSRTFDLIYSFGVLHHTPDISRALAAIRNLAHSNTFLKIMVYAKDSWKSALINEGLEQPEAQFGCPVANVYSREHIGYLLSNAGFEVTSISQDHIFPFKIEAYKNYNYEVEPWFEAMPVQMRKALEHQLGWHLLIDAKAV